MLNIAAQNVTIQINGVDYSQYLVSGSITDEHISSGSGLAPTSGTLTLRGPAEVLDNWENNDFSYGNTALVIVNGNLHPRGRLYVIAASYDDLQETLKVDLGCRLTLILKKPNPPDVRDLTDVTFGGDRTAISYIQELLTLAGAVDSTYHFVPSLNTSYIPNINFRGPINPTGGSWLTTAGEVADSLGCFLWQNAAGDIVLTAINFDYVPSLRAFNPLTNVFNLSRLNGEIPPKQIEIAGTWRRIYSNGYERSFNQINIIGTEKLDPGANPEYEKVTNWYFGGKPTLGPKFATLTERKYYSPGKQGRLDKEIKVHKLEPGVVSGPEGGNWTEEITYEYTGDFLTRKVRERVEGNFVTGIVFYEYTQLKERDVEEWVKAGSVWTYSKQSGRLNSNTNTLTVTNPDGSQSTVTNTYYTWDVSTESASGTAAQPPSAERRTPINGAESKDYSLTIDVWAEPKAIGKKVIRIPFLGDSSVAAFSWNNVNQPANLDAVATRYGEIKARFLVGTYKGLQIVSSWDSSLSWYPGAGISYTRNNQPYLFWVDSASWSFNTTQMLCSHDALYLSPGGNALYAPQIFSVTNGSLPTGHGLSGAVAVQAQNQSVVTYYVNGNTLYLDSTFQTPAQITGSVLVSGSLNTVGGLRQGGTIRIGLDVGYYGYVPTTINFGDVLRGLNTGISYDSQYLVGGATPSDRFGVNFGLNIVSGDSFDSNNPGNTLLSENSEPLYSTDGQLITG